MASEYVLIPKNKYQQLQKDALQDSQVESDSQHKTSSSSSSSSSPPPAAAAAAAAATSKQSGDKVSDRNGTPNSTDDDDDKDASAANTAADSSTRSKLQYARRTSPLPPHKEEPYDEVLDMGEIANSDDSGDTDGDDDYDVADILQSFTSSELPHVQPILKLMETNAKIMTWEHTTGEIVFQGKTVENSNVVELLKDTLNASMHPVGKMEFYRGLDLMNVKVSTIKHPKNKALLSVIKGDRPIKLKQSKTKVKRLKPVKNSSTSWLSWK